MERSSHQAEGAQHTVKWFAGPWWINKRVYGNTHEASLQRVIGVRWCVFRKRPDQIDQDTDKLQDRVSRQVGRSQPIVLPRVRELVREQPGAVPFEDTLLHNDHVSNGNCAEASKPSGR